MSVDSKMRAALETLDQMLSDPQPNLILCRNLVYGMQHLLTEKEQMITEALQSSGNGLGIDLAGLARHMVNISPLWRSSDIAEITMQVMLERWGHWFSSHWHAAGFVAGLMPFFYEAGGKVDEMAAKWKGTDVPFNVWETEREAGNS